MRKENTTLYEWEERRVRRSSYAGHTSVGEKRRGGCRFIAADWQTHKCRHRSKRAREVPPHFEHPSFSVSNLPQLNRFRELDANQTIYQTSMANVNQGNFILCLCRMSQKNALSESSSCKQQPQGDQIYDVLNMISPRLLLTGWWFCLFVCVD